MHAGSIEAAVRCNKIACSRNIGSGPYPIALLLSAPFIDSPWEASRLRQLTNKSFAD